MLDEFETTIDVIILTETWFIERLRQGIDGYLCRLPHVHLYRTEGTGAGVSV